MIPVVYSNLLLTSFLGSRLKHEGSPLDLALGAVASSTLFFLTVNLSVWMSSGLYPKNILSLTGCYFAALPFYANQIVATFAFSVLFVKLTSQEGVRNVSVQTVAPIHG